VTSPLSVQLYTVREALAADLPGTLQRIAQIGFRQVEPFGFVEHADAYAEALPAAGLVAPSSHASLIGQDLAPILAAAQKVGVGTVIDPFVDPERWTSREGVEGVAAELNRIAAQAADSGIRIGYHNHAFELENRIDGVAALEVLAGSLDPAVLLEVDTYWAQVGGEDAVALLGRLGEKVQFLHIKDGAITHENKEQVAVGSGRMPIREILAAAPQALPVVELDDFEGDVFDAVADSWAFLNGDAR
jgi:sugar phosphate isomerase/epimerase